MQVELDGETVDFIKAYVDEKFDGNPSNDAEDDFSSDFGVYDHHANYDNLMEIVYRIYVGNRTKFCERMGKE